MIMDAPLSLEVRHRYAATPERVFRAWTEADQVRRWWKLSEGHHCTQAEIDLRVGGSYQFQMAAKEGAAMPAISGSYLEIDPPRRLVFTWRWVHHPVEKETLVTVEFRTAAEGCEVVLMHTRFPDANMRDQHEQGWCAVLKMLEATRLDG